MNMRAFADELISIKLAEEKKPRDWAPLKRTLGRIAVFSVGTGIGSAGAKMLSDKYHLPEAIQKLPDPIKKHLPTILGVAAGAGALLAAEGFKLIFQKPEAKEEKKPGTV